MSKPSFASLKLSDALLNNLKSLGYEQTTPIQAQALPHILAGQDVIGQAETGSGKTAAFALGLLSKLEVKRFKVQSLVLCPTRELADQVANEIRKLARSTHNIKVLTLCGGSPFGPQVGSLEHGAHIIVGTPGRVEEHVRKKNLDLRHVKMLVLDEADRMLEMGFQETLESILKNVPQERQNLMFSATFSPPIKAMVKKIMRNPKEIKVDSDNPANITEHYFDTEANNRSHAVQLLLMRYQPESCVIFCRTKQQTQDLSDELSALGFSAKAIHGDLEQRERDQVLVRFSNKSLSILVATDVAARGLDIDDLDAVINFEMARDLEVHVHRIGRTGRAGKNGIALTLVTNKEHYRLKQLEEFLNKDIIIEALPDKDVLNKAIKRPPMITLQIDGGKKDKIRPGDILGALTGENGISGKDVGKIKVNPMHTYVAVSRNAIRSAMNKLKNDKIKGRQFRVRSF